MNKQQFATLAIGIKSAYPASKILEDKASMDFWYMTLKDLSLIHIQYNQLVARRVRECNVYCEIYSYKIDIEKIKEMNPKGIILTGGPKMCIRDRSYKDVCGR